MTNSPPLWLRSWRRLSTAWTGEEFSSLVQSALPAGLRLAGAFLQLLSTILIARTLGVAESGMYFFWAAAMLEVGQVATYGLDRLALQQVPRLDSKNGELRNFLAPLRAFVLLLGLLLAIGLCAYALIFQPDAGRSLWWYLLPFLCVSGVAMSMVNSEAMAGLGRPVLAIICRHTILNVLLISAVFLLGSHLTADLAITAYALAFFLSGFSAFGFRGFREQGVPFGFPSGSQVRYFWREGSPLFVGSVFATMGFMIPLAVLERTHSSSEIALVTTGFRIFVLVDVLARAIHSLVMPQLSRAAHKSEGKRLFQIYRSAVFKGIAILGLPIVGMFVLATPVMNLFGEGFGEGAPLFRIFMAFALNSLLLGPAQQLLLMVGHTKTMAAFSLVYCLTAGILSIFLVPTFGPIAFVYAICIGLLIEKVLVLNYSARAIRKVEFTSEGGQQ
ncbi:MAG: lipopolysaccharide biosynthesis protein [Verrucomicrobiota bacterium]